MPKSTSSVARKASTHKRITCSDITDYLRIVEHDEVASCVEQHKLAAYVRKVYADEELYIDADLLSQYLGYQRFFPFELFPWERFILACVYCTFKPDGRPRWSIDFEYMGRGGGKNGFMEFKSFCLVSKAHGIEHYDCPFVANSEDQSRITFSRIWELLERNASGIAAGFDWNKNEIVNKSTRSKLDYYTANSNTKDGFAPGCIFFDELHAYQDWSLINVFRTGLGKVPHPRTCYSTTDGDVRDGPLDTMKQRCEDILDGKIADNGMFPFICKLDSMDEIGDEAMWTKANPSLPYLPDLLEEIRTEYVDYSLDPTKAFDFATKRMNLPQGRSDLEVTSWENLVTASRDIGDVSGLPCVCGIDYAKTTDMVGACLVFRSRGEYKAMPHAWFCTASSDKAAIKAPLDEWASRGLLTMVDDVEVAPSLVSEWIRDKSALYDIQRVCIDSYRHTLLARSLADDAGFSATAGTVKLVRPSDIMLVQPVINSAFATRSIAWGDNPLMRWCANNAKLEPAAHGNYVYGKIEPHSRKTDVFMAFVAAMTEATKIEEYEEPVFMAPLVF